MIINKEKTSLQLIHLKKNNSLMDDKYSTIYVGYSLY